MGKYEIHRQIDDHGNSGAGNWELQISGIDAAGNSAQSPLNHLWTVAFQAGLQYARFKAAPFGLTNNSEPSFSLLVRIPSNNEYGGPIV